MPYMQLTFHLLMSWQLRGLLTGAKPDSHWVQQNVHVHA